MATVTKLINPFNAIVGNKFINVFGTISASVLAGYCLQPVPKRLNHVFNTSLFARFVILLTVGVMAYHPVNGQNLAFIIISILIIQLSLEVWRYKYEDGAGNTILHAGFWSGKPKTRHTTKPLKLNN